MATKRVWAGSAVLLFLSFFRAYAGGNDSRSLDMQPSSPPSFTMKLTSAETDGVKTTEHGTSASPHDVQHTNEITAGAAASSVNMGGDENSISARMETTLAPSTTNLPRINFTARPRDRSKTQPGEIKWDDKWDEPFEYDYSSLRQAGLTIAAVLFLLGIMLITCGKIRCRHCSHVGKGRSYEVTRM